MKKCHQTILTGALLAVLAPSPSMAAGYSQTFKLTASDAAPGHLFGQSVDISGDIGIVGARLSGNGGGSAYLFDAATGNQIFKLNASDTELGDDFGEAVAISGNTAIVGAKDDDDNGFSSGSAYLFDATTGSQTYKLTPSDGVQADEFGYAVGISGNTAIVGAIGTDSGPGNSVGSAYLFDITTGNQKFKLSSSDNSAFDDFGYSVGISGNTAIVGAVFDDDAGSQSGSAYLFDATTGNQSFKLTASDAAPEDYFGWSVGINGNTAIVGAILDDDNGDSSGSAYLFDTSTGNQTFKLTASDASAGDEFGWSVAISGDTAIVGAVGVDNASGSVYLFDTTSGNQIGKLSATDAANSDFFGSSVGINGNTIIVGATFDDDAGSQSGSAYLFTNAGPLLDTDPDSGSTLTFLVAPNIPETKSDLITLANTGTDGSVIEVNGFLITGEDAGLFTVSDFANATLTTADLDSVNYDLQFSGGAIGEYEAQLTFFTSSGNVNYNVIANVVPEPNSLILLAVGGLLCTRRRSR